MHHMYNAMPPNNHCPIAKPILNTITLTTFYLVQPQYTKSSQPTPSRPKARHNSLQLKPSTMLPGRLQSFALQNSYSCIMNRPCLFACNLPMPPFFPPPIRCNPL